MSSTYVMTIMVAVSAGDILETSKAVGTASNQMILGGLVVALIVIVLYRERQQNRQHEQQIAANKEAADKAERAIQEADRKHSDAMALATKERSELHARMEKAHAEMNEERRQRWTMMIDVVRENTIAFRGVRETLDTLQRYLVEAKPNKGVR